MVFCDEYWQLTTDFADTALLYMKDGNDAATATRKAIDDHLLYSEDIAVAVVANLSDEQIAELLTPEILEFFSADIMGRIEDLSAEDD